MKLRPKLQMFSTPNGFKAFFCIQICQQRRWTFLGDKTGIYKFDVKEDRDTKMKELREIPLAPSSKTAP